MSRKRTHRALPPTGVSFLMSLVRGTIDSFKRGNRTASQVVDDIYLRAEALETRAGYMIVSDVSLNEED